MMDCPVPQEFKCSNLSEVVSLVESFPSMDEGLVLVWETSGPSGHIRLKCKNSKYVAIHHLRSNGVITPYRILHLIMQNETEEYLNYFSEDTPYFNYINELYEDFQKDILDTYDNCNHFESQKEFALAIMSAAKYKASQGVIFNLRKGKDMKECLYSLGAKKIEKALNMKSKFVEKFKINISDLPDEDEGDDK